MNRNGCISNFITNYIQEIFVQEYESVDISPDDDLIELRLIDSLNIIRIVVAIQEEYNITLNIEDLSINNFSTINKMIKFVSELDEASTL